VAAEIREHGGSATASQLDALDGRAVDEHADEVVRDHGSLDISMNLISTGDVQGTPLVEMDVADFEQPIHNAIRSTGRHMIRQGSGVILMFGGEGDPIRDYSIGGFQISLTAVEALRKQLASELGRHGIRVVSLLTGGVIDAIDADFEGRDALVESLVAPTLLGRGATLQDVGDVAAFVASDKARTITASAINITCGAIIT
jgi:enoyl-[acyl-carrier-protein] reductase (NADH)